MLLLMMELKGRFNGKMIKRAKFGDVYFDDMGGFESIERDRVTGAVSLTSSHSLRSLALRNTCTGRGQEGAYFKTNKGPACTAHAACIGKTAGRGEQNVGQFY